MIFVLFVYSELRVSLRSQGQLLVTLQGWKGLTDFRDEHVRHSTELQVIQKVRSCQQEAWPERERQKAFSTTQEQKKKVSMS